MDSFLRFAGRASAFAAYRPVGIGAVRHIPAEALGIAHYGVGEIASLPADALSARAGEIGAELEALDAVAEWSPEQRGTFDSLKAELDAIEGRQADLKARAEVRSRAASASAVEHVGGPTVRVARTADDAFDLRNLSFASSDGEVRGRALTAIEKMPEVPDHIRQRATQVVQKLPVDVARRVLLTGSVHYRTAYQKAMVGQSMLWTNEEREAFRAALSLTDGNGGYAVPFNLDPTIISSKNVSTNPFRRIGRVVQGVTDTWNGVSTAGVTASFDSESAEVSDDSPAVTQPAITAYMARAFARGSIEISMDWAAIEEDLRILFQEAKDDLEGSKMALGSGSAEPYGIVTALAGTGSEINAAADDTFALADVYTVDSSLPPKYRLATLDGDVTTSRASWVANHAIYNKIRQFDTAGGAGLLEYLGNGLPPRLLGYPIYEASGMDSSITTSGAVSNFVLVLGDFRNFVIYDRIGFQLEFIPHLFHTSNNLPSGQRGWFAYWRVGSDSVNDDAFRLLDVPSAS